MVINALNVTTQDAHSGAEGSGGVPQRRGQDSGPGAKKQRDLRVFDSMNGQGYFAQPCGVLDRIGGNVDELEQREAVAE